MRNRECAVDGCERMVRSSGAIWCEKHYYRVRRTGTTDVRQIERYTLGQVCAVDTCDRTDLRAHGWCALHYARWRAHGDVSYVPREVTPFPDVCEIDGCDKKPKKRSRICSMHAVRIERHGDPNVKLNPGSPGGPANPKWAPDELLTYSTVHQHLKKIRGPASKYRCAVCGGQAQQWSYDHKDPDQRVGPEGPFSIKVMIHYRPLCIPCHKTFDLGILRSAT